MRKKTGSQADRSRLREAQILRAAKHCFARVGFHSTSMAQIAARAKMSVGQIYRHFRSKEALIEGIVREDVARQLSLVNLLPDHELVDALTGAGPGRKPTGAGADAKYLALMLEIVAEAARNPKVRDIVLSNQRHGHTELKRRIERAQPGAWPPAELDLRLRLVSAIMQGVATQILLDGRAPAAALLKRANSIARQLLFSAPEGASTL